MELKTTVRLVGEEGGKERGMMYGEDVVPVLSRPRSPDGSEGLLSPTPPSPPALGRRKVTAVTLWNMCKGRGMERVGGSGGGGGLRGVGGGGGRWGSAVSVT